VVVVYLVSVVGTSVTTVEVSVSVVSWVMVLFIVVVGPVTVSCSVFVMVELFT